MSGPSSGVRRFPLRALLAVAAVSGLFLVSVSAALAAGPPFPDPIADVSVYDPADAISAGTETALESRIDAIERRSGAEIAIYVQVKPGISEDENLDDARALMDQWGIGRSGFDDGLVVMIGLDESGCHGRISLFGGSGFLNAYVDEDGLSSIIQDDMVPHARACDLDAALLGGVDALDRQVTADGRQRLESSRQINAVLGLVVAPITLLLLGGVAYRAWRLDGDDPDFLDSPSVLMAGPPAGMTPPLATVLTKGRATQHTLDTALVELAGRGYISFLNLDRVKEVKRDSIPDPLLDPAIVVLPAPTDDRPLPAAEARAAERIRQLAGPDGRLSRTALWSLNDELGPLKRDLDAEAMRLGWLAHLPGPAITRWTTVGVLEIVLGIIFGWIGLSAPMSGMTLIGVALGLAGLITIAFGMAMSKRTPNGAMVDGMLRAYRRTLQKTLEQARSMEQVVEEPSVRVLADTPDRALIWGFALGLHREIGEVLERSLEDYREGRVSHPGYYPGWLASTGSEPMSLYGGAGSVVQGSGGIFSGSGIPDFGSMFSALGSIGSTPASSSSSGGGGFGGGGSSGGGGASGSF